MACWVTPVWRIKNHSAWLYHVKSEKTKARKNMEKKEIKFENFVTGKNNFAKLSVKIQRYLFRIRVNWQKTKYSVCFYASILWLTNMIICRWNPLYRVAKWIFNKVFPPKNGRNLTILVGIEKNDWSLPTFLQFYIAFWLKIMYTIYNRVKSVNWDIDE